MLTRDPWVRALVIVLLAIAGLYLAGLIWQVAERFADIILLFFLAWVVAFILEPVVDLLRREAGLPRPLAVTLAYVGMLIVGAAAVIWMVPALSRQIAQFVTELPAYLAFINDHALEWQANLEERGIFVNLGSLVQIEELVRRAESVGPPILANAVTLATQIASVIVQFVIVLILSFYVMLDGQRIKLGVLGLVPPSFRQDVDFFFSSVNRAFAGFLRGQLIQALLYSVGAAAIMWAAGLDLILLTAVVNTLLMLIPFVGPPVAIVLPLAITIFEKPDLFWIVCIVINALQLVVINVVAPRVMSSAVGVHPLLVFLGLLAGARVAGVWGALFGVPAVAVIAAMISFYHATLERRRTEGSVSDAATVPELEEDLDEAMADDVSSTPRRTGRVRPVNGPRHPPRGATGRAATR
ncbi:MAG: AI-2E family transporter [Chloroflexi bacterium]|nr:AI-2E family transporter [Chloroflexota bacterium]